MPASISLLSLARRTAGIFLFSQRIKMLKGERKSSRSSNRPIRATYFQIIFFLNRESIRAIEEKIRQLGILLAAMKVGKEVEEEVEAEGNDADRKIVESFDFTTTDLFDFRND